MPSVAELKAETKREIMVEVTKAISGLEASLNKHIEVANKNFELVTKHLYELSGRRER